MTLRRASLATVLALLLAAGGAAFWVWARRPRLGPLHAAPDARRLSIEVGEAVHFSAAAPGAVEFTWSMWGSAVSHLPTWTYVALPEDAGWQQVTVVVRGATGGTLMHAWDVGVVPPPLCVAVVGRQDLAGPGVVDLDPEGGDLGQALRLGRPPPVLAGEDVPARALGEHRSEEAVLLDALADALDVSPVRILRVGRQLVDRRQLVLLRGDRRLGGGHAAPHRTQNPKPVRA